MSVYLRDANHNISVRINNKGYYFVRGTQEASSTAFWSLQEPGSWVSSVRWESSDRRKVLEMHQGEQGRTWWDHEGEGSEFKEIGCEVVLWSQRDEAIYKLTSEEVCVIMPSKSMHQGTLDFLDVIEAEAGSSKLGDGAWEWADLLLKWVPAMGKAPTFSMTASPWQDTRGWSDGGLIKSREKGRGNGRKREHDGYDEGDSKTYRLPLPKKKR